MVTCAAGVTTEGHCCWIDGVVCPFLRDDGAAASRRWVCTLREELGSWPAVHADKRYLTFVRDPLHRVVEVDCGDWPPPGEKCAECGAIGD
jgi:hypothetical protein